MVVRDKGKRPPEDRVGWSGTPAGCQTSEIRPQQPPHDGCVLHSGPPGFEVRSPKPEGRVPKSEDRNPTPRAVRTSFGLRPSAFGFYPLLASLSLVPRREGGNWCIHTLPSPGEAGGAGNPKSEARNPKQIQIDGNGAMGKREGTMFLRKLLGNLMEELLTEK